MRQHRFGAAGVGDLAALVHRLNLELNEVVLVLYPLANDPEVNQKLTGISFQVVGSTPAAFLEKVRRDYDQMGKLIETRGIKVE